MYRYIHADTDRQVYTYRCTYARKYISVYIHTYICTYLRAYTHKHICSDTHTYVHMCVHMFVRVCIRMYRCTYVQTCTYRDMYTRVCRARHVPEASVQRRLLVRPRAQEGPPLFWVFVSHLSVFCPGGGKRPGRGTEGFRLFSSLFVCRRPGSGLGSGSCRLCSGREFRRPTLVPSAPPGPPPQGCCEEEGGGTSTGRRPPLQGCCSRGRERLPREPQRGSPAEHSLLQQPLRRNQSERDLFPDGH